MIKTEIRKKVNEYAQIVHNDGLTSEAAMKFVTDSMDDQKLFKLCKTINRLKSKKYRWSKDYTSRPMYDLKGQYLGLENELDAQDHKSK